jgi:sugar lactone lactonase YvrE
MSCGRKGSEPDELLRPHAVDLGDDGSIFVVDVDNSKVVAYGPDGSFIRCWGCKGTAPSEFWAPHGIAVDPSGDIFVAEYNGRCQKFTPEGEAICCFANPSLEEGSTHGYYRYHSIASDALGNVYLMARNTLRGFFATVEKYNNLGGHVTSLPEPEDERTKMGTESAAVSPSGRIFVADHSREHSGVSFFDPI